MFCEAESSGGTWPSLSPHTLAAEGLGSTNLWPSTFFFMAASANKGDFNGWGGGGGTEDTESAEFLIHATKMREFGCGDATVFLEVGGGQGCLEAGENIGWAQSQCLI